MWFVYTRVPLKLKKGIVHVSMCIACCVSVEVRGKEQVITCYQHNFNVK
jgi:hypothetical protein